MATIKELKDFLSQFPDDMETDIDIVEFEKYAENDIYTQYLKKSIELMELTHKNLMEKFPYLKKYND